MRYAPGSSLPEAVDTCLRESSGAGALLPAWRGRDRAGAPRAGECDDAGTRRRDRRAPWVPRRGGAGRGDCGDRAAPDHPGDQHRRDVADGSRRLGRRRRRAAQGRALRSRPRRRQPRDRADLPGRGGPAGGPRRPAWTGIGDQAVAPARSPATAPRAGDPARRSVRRRARHPGLGRRPAVVRLVRDAVTRPRRCGVRAARASRRHERGPVDRCRTPDAAAAAQPPPVGHPARRRRRAGGGGRLRAALGAPLSGRAAGIASDDGERSAERRRARSAIFPSTCSGRRARCSRSSTDTARRPLDEAQFRRALLAGYPDRVGRRRAPGSPRVLLASGHGAVVGPESGVRERRVPRRARRHGRTAGRSSRSADQDGEHRGPQLADADAHARRTRLRSPMPVSCAPCRATTTTRWSSSNARRPPTPAKSSACWSTPTWRSR